MRTIPLLMILCIATSCASEFQDSGFSFDIPEGWQVIENNDTNLNDTKIVLIDTNSSIRIDLVKIPEIAALMNVSSIQGNLQNLLFDYYQAEILNEKRGYDSSIRSTSNSRQIHPDGINDYIYFGTDMWDPKMNNPEGVGKGGEWIIAWSKKGYGDRIIGVHALFNGNYSVVDLSYNNDWVYPAPEVLVDLINSIKTDFPEASGTKTRMWELHSSKPITAI